ncbi:hypothetical protein HK102_011335, partial [Quaeritorhiza haematococci]
MYRTGYCPTATLPDGTLTRLPCPDGYGAFLGTCMLTALVEIFLSFLPPRTLKKLFPPVVTGVVVLLIGVELTGVGMKYWGGGAGPCIERPGEGSFFAVCPNVGSKALAHAWGDPAWIGLGLAVFGTVLLVEIIGSPFMRNVGVVMGLLVGLAVASGTGHVDWTSVEEAPVVTFLWRERFRLGIYPPAIIPLMVGFVTLMIECIGDITASCDVSRVPITGPTFSRRIQGGTLSDGLNGILSALMTSTPLSVFAQNNGIISLTRAANTRAGYFACIFLILFGVFSKLGAIFLAIPDAVLGGMTTFLFASVA